MHLLTSCHSQEVLSSVGDNLVKGISVFKVLRLGSGPKKKTWQ